VDDQRSSFNTGTIQCRFETKDSDPQSGAPRRLDGPPAILRLVRVTRSLRLHVRVASESSKFLAMGEYIVSSSSLIYPLSLQDVIIPKNAGGVEFKVFTPSRTYYTMFDAPQK
jgi:hypothetical protein